METSGFVLFDDKGCLSDRPRWGQNVHLFSFPTNQKTLNTSDVLLKMDLTGVNKLKLQIRVVYALPKDKQRGISR